MDYKFIDMAFRYRYSISRAVSLPDVLEHMSCVLQAAQYLLESYASPTNANPSGMFDGHPNSSNASIVWSIPADSALIVRPASSRYLDIPRPWSYTLHCSQPTFIRLRRRKLVRMSTYEMVLTLSLRRSKMCPLKAISRLQLSADSSSDELRRR